MTNSVPDGASHSNNDGVSVILSGEIDLVNATKVKKVLLEAIDQCSQPRVVVDAAAVTFMDSVGLNALIAAVNHAKTKSLPVVLASPSYRVKRLIDIAGLKETLPIVEC